MLKELEKEILKKSIQIRLDKEEDVLSIIKSYKNLTEEEKKDLLSEFSIEYTQTLEEAKKQKREEISNKCEQTIYNGIDVEFVDGTKHFSLTVNDQLNLFGKQVQLALGLEQYEYHSDGEPCKYYSKEDMSKIITEAMSFVSYHTTYCNSFYTWIEAQETVDDVTNMNYGDEIPEQYKSEVLKSYEK